MNFRQAYEVLPELNLKKKVVLSRFIQVYKNFYNLGFPDADHFIGTFKACNFTITAQVFKPAKSSGTVFMIHGYLDHSALMRNLILHCLQRGYNVAIFDLPGHGLSSGSIASISSFDLYIQILQKFISITESDLQLPFYFAGHSTGCSIAYQFVVSDPSFEKVLFIAPLIRPKHYLLMKLVYPIFKNRISRLPRIHRETSSDKEYVKFRRSDPLWIKNISFDWIKALLDWNERIKAFRPVRIPTLVIQGTSDKVVNWRYNVSFLSEKLPHSEIYYINGAKHDLCNEMQVYRQMLMSEIDRSFF